MTDDLASDFMKPLREAQRQLDDLRAEIAAKQKELAATESQRAIAGKALSELSDERSAMQTALNKTRAELATAQNNLAAIQAAYEETRTKILKAIG